MRYPDSFTVTTPSEREIEITRSFAAPRALLFDAFTKPELVRRWLLSASGSTPWRRSSCPRRRTSFCS